ncbi:MAG: dockerin type I domain-containing protein [Planctomycetota bacterium]
MTLPPRQPDDLPEQLLDDLRALHAPKVEVPPSVDEHILAAARRTLPVATRTPWFRRPSAWGGITAAAAAVGLAAVAWIAQPGVGGSRSTTTTTPRPFSETTEELALADELSVLDRLDDSTNETREFSRGASIAEVQPEADMFGLPLASRAAERADFADAAHPLDYDGDGVIDILDAFALARTIETQVAIEPMWDLNGDGVIDDDDVVVIAQAAVRLEPREVIR